MAANENLGGARKAKNDEFYTQYADIEREMNAYLDFDPDVFRGKTILLPCDDPEWSNFTKYFAQNFERHGIKKLISTSYAPNSKPKSIEFQPTLFEMQSDEFDELKTQANGKIFTLTRDITGDDVIDVEDLEWSYLECDGDFRSDEVTALRDEADIIITNPPFSKFREFLSWLIGADKSFAILSNKNSVTYADVFPLIKDNLIWPGSTPMGTEMVFYVPKEIGEEMVASGKDRTWSRVNGEIMGRSSSLWLTNLDHGRRHSPLPLMTEAENVKFNKHKEIRNIGYRKYDNYDAIEVPFTDAIPSDYEGAMGVPISFLSKYSSEQFEIIGCTESEGKGFSNGLWDEKSGVPQPLVAGTRLYKRIFIRHRKEAQ